jgi:hypothetical protein
MGNGLFESLLSAAIIAKPAGLMQLEFNGIRLRVEGKRLWAHGARLMANDVIRFYLEP